MEHRILDSLAGMRKRSIGNTSSECVGGIISGDELGVFQGRMKNFSVDRAIERIKRDSSSRYMA
jgi:hypothetical protein